MELTKNHLKSQLSHMRRRSGSIFRYSHWKTGNVEWCRPQQGVAMWSPAYIVTKFYSLIVIGLCVVNCAVTGCTVCKLCADWLSR